MPHSRTRGRAAAAGRAGRRRAGLAGPGARLRAHLHLHLADHHLLRILWQNREEFAPGAWRANQPSPAQLARYRDRGIRTVLSLRGGRAQGWHLLEAEACARLGLALVVCPLASRALVPAPRLLALLDTFERIERPFLMHCKSGSDRTGLAAALYLLHVEGATVEAARRQLHWRFVHFRGGRTGILDHMIDAYARDRAESGIAIRDWIATRYDPAALTAAWMAATGHRAPPGRPGA